MVACAPMQEKFVQMRAHQQLERYRDNMATGFFEIVIEQNEQILAENETKPPADVALYVLGEVYARHDFAGRDYSKSQYYFEKLIENFPESKLTSEAKTYVSLFETIAGKEKEVAVKEELLRQEVKAKAAAEEKIPQKEIIVEKEKKSVPVPGRVQVVENQNFEEALKKNLQILEQLGNKKPADEALYNLGLLYAHVDNPAKDYNKSKVYFNALSTQFPDSDFAEEARIWLGLFERYGLGFLKP